MSVVTHLKIKRRVSMQAGSPDTLKRCERESRLRSSLYEPIDLIESYFASKALLQDDDNEDVYDLAHLVSGHGLCSKLLSIDDLHLGAKALHHLLGALSEVSELFDDRLVVTNMNDARQGSGGDNRGGQQTHSGRGCGEAEESSIRVQIESAC